MMERALVSKGDAKYSTRIKDGTHGVISIEHHRTPPGQSDSAVSITDEFAPILVLTRISLS